MKTNYKCQECDEPAEVRGNEIIEPEEQTPYISKWVVCTDCGYTIPKDAADVERLLETCRVAVLALTHLPVNPDDVQFIQRAIKQVESEQ